MERWQRVFYHKTNLKQKPHRTFCFQLPIRRHLQFFRCTRHPAAVSLLSFVLSRKTKFPKETEKDGTAQTNTFVFSIFYFLFFIKKKHFQNDSMYLWNCRRYNSKSRASDTLSIDSKQFLPSVFTVVERLNRLLLWREECRWRDCIQYQWREGNGGLTCACLYARGEKRHS